MVCFFQIKQRKSGNKGTDNKGTGNKGTGNKIYLTIACQIIITNHFYTIFTG